MIELTHGRVRLWLRQLTTNEGSPLLLLHGLGGSGEDWGREIAVWPGPVFALDFSGHGRSGALRGGGYFAELLVGDADAVLAHVGPARVAGIGLGAYVALLLAGTRPELVPAALLGPGPGLDGGGSEPVIDRSPEPFADPSEEFVSPGLVDSPRCDPRTARLDLDLRPTDYAESFARRARSLWFLEDGDACPPWWRVASNVETARTLSTDFEAGLAAFASEAGRAGSASHAEGKASL